MPAKPRPRPRKRRAASYFGIHIDLHANDQDRELGKHVSEAMVRRMIRAAKPDYIQYDCKGHCGFLAYPDSKISRTAGADGGKGIIRDSLAIYRKVTAEEGVALYMHFSGVWDNEALRDHPEWAALGPDGKPYAKEGQFVTGAVSNWSPYVTERMIPQMKEVIDRYKVDGFWVDGEAWAVKNDYCPAAVTAFRKAVGDTAAVPPTKPDEPHWHEWMTVQREQFFVHLSTYMHALHAYKPEIQVASNWLYSAMAPEPVKLPVDFISGDYDSHNSVNSARFHGRYISSIGLPWDLMAWAFGWFPSIRSHVSKTAVQLQQEAAAVIALGGGFQFYFHPDRHGGFDDQQIQLMKDVADFVRPRKDACFQSETLPQVCLLLDTTTVFKTSQAVYCGGWAGEYDALRGTLEGVLDAGHHVDILADHELHGRFDEWPVIVVPEWKAMDDGMVRELLAYARRGGSLFVIGAETCRRFGDVLGVVFLGEPVEVDAVLRFGRHMTRVKGPWQKVSLKKGKTGARVLFERTPGFKRDVGGEPAVTLAPLGRGRIAAAFGPLGTAHGQMHAPASRDLIGAVLNKLYRPVVTLAEGTPAVVDLIVRRKEEGIVVHLNNTTNMAAQASAQHDRYFFPDYIPPTPAITFSVRLDEKPRKVTLQPEGRALRGKWYKGVLTVTVPPVAIHSAVVIS